MPRFAANLSMMFTEAPFMDRFGAAAKAGFKAVEYLFPYDFPAEQIAAQLKEHGLTQVLFNLYPGNWAGGDRGMASIPGREKEFADSVDKAISYARTLDCKTVHAMAGFPPAGSDPAVLEKTYRANIALAAKKLEDAGLTLVIEPINQRSMPGYFLKTQAQAAAFIQEIGAPNLKLQFDYFHVQMQEGCVALKFKEYFSIIGHCQLAGAPERHEPDIGELNYAYLFAQSDALGYKGYIGCEYNPAGGTTAGLGWFAPYKGR